jgi:ABC-type glutathione transport system ATPase component
MPEPTILLDDVRVTYVQGWMGNRQRVEALRGVSLSIKRGETVGLVGESGSGKTTLAKVALGLVRPTSGTVVFEGRPIERRRGAPKGRFQVVLQNPDWSLNPYLRVGSSISEPLAILGIGDRNDRAQRARDTLELVGLDSSFADRFPHQLSGGQRQRVAIARALVTQPAFIVFDEVVSALDVSVQAQVLNLIQRLQSEQQFSALFISHDLAVVRYVSDRIGVLYGGELVELSDSPLFYSQPRHPYSRQLVEANV